GLFIGSSDAARSLLGFRNLTEAGLDDARSDALKQGRSETPVGIGHMVLQRVGTGADIGLVALIAPHATPAGPVEQTIPPAPQAAASFMPENVIPETVLPEALPPTVAAPVGTPAPSPATAYEQPAISGEAPAEFALVDEFEETPEIAGKPEVEKPCIVAHA